MTRIATAGGSTFLPLVAKLFLNVVGQTVPGTALSAYGFQLLPISFGNSVIQTLSRSIQTGDWLRPELEFARQWLPNARIIGNRLPMREGITNKAAQGGAHGSRSG